MKFTDSKHTSVGGTIWENSVTQKMYKIYIFII